MVDVTLNLVQLAFVCAVEVTVLQVIFDTPLYQHYFGKGKDGRGSAFFSHNEVRPWIAMALGVATAYLFHMTILIDGLGINLSDLIATNGEAPVHFDRIITGIAIGGGAKTIKSIAKRFSETREEVKKSLA